MSKTRLDDSCWSEMNSASSFNKSDLNNKPIAIKHFFCDTNNINHCIAYLSQELQALGFAPLYENDCVQFDNVKLINAIYCLLKLNSRNTKDNEEFEERFNRLHYDYDLALKETNRFRDRLENSERSLQTFKETNRQLTLKTRSLQGALKTEKDEIKRLQGIISQRDAQFHNELRRKEREISTLKERLLNAISDKGVERKLGMAISNNIPRQDGRRGKWQTKALSTQSGDELQKQIASSYEKRNKLLIDENILLRQSFQKQYKNLLEMEDKSQSTELDNGYLIDSESKWFKLPFSQVIDKIESAFGEKTKSIKNRLIYLEELLKTNESIVVDDNDVEKLNFLKMKNEKEWKRNQESSETPPFLIRNQSDVSFNFEALERVPSSSSDFNESPTCNAVDIDKLLLEFQRNTKDD